MSPGLYKKVDFPEHCGSFQSMKTSAFTLTLSLCLGAACLPVVAEDADWLKVEEGPKRSAIGHEFGLSHSYTDRGEIDQGDKEVGKLGSQASKFFYVMTTPVAEKVALRTGVDYGRYSLDIPDNTLLPNTLQSVAVTLGADVELSEHWLMRFEVSPGLYSDFQDISTSDFNAPIILGFSYLVDSKLQIVFGLAVDPLFSTKINGLMDSPAFPGVGVRWQFADKWTLNAILPEPEIQYDFSDQIQLFAGGRIKGGSYRVSEHHGSDVGRQDFNNDVVSYQEVRAGVGARYRVHPAVTLEAELGYTLERSLRFRNEDGLNYDGGSAPYAQLGLKGKF
ncbi:MAG: DUF6268 family outer membrane beta-barrel protein [Candidatus Methylacidiphilales bacterium]|nr:DUF6268 family outer membrane beta-barrel protein [Candidatus Methylacidiphilales bacterium]